MIETILEWYEGQGLLVKALLLAPVLLVALVLIVPTVLRQVVPRRPQPVTANREQKGRDLDKERERTITMINRLQSETEEIEKERAEKAEEAKNAHEAIDAAGSFDAVDRVRESER